MTGMVTYVGLDVHAVRRMPRRLTSRRVSFCGLGSGVEEPVAWLLGLRGPVCACYEAGPTGFGHAAPASVAVEVIARGKTPGAPQIG